MQILVWHILLLNINHRYKMLKIEMKVFTKIALTIAISLICVVAKSQDTSKIFFTTSAGILLQTTSSSVFLVGFNVGRNVNINNSGTIFFSPYIGLGYANIGEPRLTVNNTTNIITQEVTRMNGLFTRGGLRLGYKTKSKVLQTIYLDASYWTTNIDVQNSKPQALSILVGTRFGF